MPLQRFGLGNELVRFIDRLAHRIADVRKAQRVILMKAAVRYPSTYPEVLSTIVGVRTAAHVREAAARHGRAIPDALWDELAERALVSAGGRQR